MRSNQDINMHRIFIISSLLFIAIYANSQNLITNPSFEESGEPFCEGWYAGCCIPLVNQCDTIKTNGVSIVRNVPPDSLRGEWSAEVYGSFPISSSVVTYIPARNGTYIYQLKFWMNTSNHLGAACINLKKNTSSECKWISDSDQPWKEYSMLDTITGNSTDTIYIWLTAGLGDFCVCDVTFDLIELTIIDSLTTGIEQESDYTATKVFPNPFKDDFSIHATDCNGFKMSVFDMNGKEIKTIVSHSPSLSVDLSSAPDGIYFYRIDPFASNERPYYGKLIKQ
jgi:hypothetical protein